MKLKGRKIVGLMILASMLAQASLAAHENDGDDGKEGSTMNQQVNNGQPFWMQRVTSTFQMVGNIFSNFPNINNVPDVSNDKKEDSHESKLLEKKINVSSGFNEIKVDGPVDVRISKSKEPSLKASCHEEFMDRIQVNVSKGVLNIFFQGGIQGTEKYNPKIPVINVGANEIRKIAASRASSVNLTGSNSPQRLDIHIDDASGFNGNVVAKKVNIISKGASSVNLKGKIDEVHVDVSRASQVDLSGAKLGTVKASVEQVSQATLSEVNYLEANLKQMAKMTYSTYDNCKGKDKMKINTDFTSVASCVKKK